jgi:hypothetical protein
MHRVRALEALQLRKRQTRDDDVRWQVECELIRACRTAAMSIQRCPSNKSDKRRLYNSLFEEVVVARERVTALMLLPPGAHEVDVSERTRCIAGEYLASARSNTNSSFRMIAMGSVRSA